MNSVHKTENMRKYRTNHCVKENNQNIASSYSHPFSYSPSVYWMERNTECSWNTDSHWSNSQDVNCTWTTSQEYKKRAMSPDKGTSQEHGGYYSHPRDYSFCRINTSQACQRSEAPAQWFLRDSHHTGCSITSSWQYHQPQFVATSHEERVHTKNKQEEAKAGWQNSYSISNQSGKTHCPSGFSDKMSKIASATAQNDNHPYKRTPNSPKEWYTYEERQLLQMQNNFYPPSFNTFSAASTCSTKLQGTQPLEAQEKTLEENPAQSCRTNLEHSPGRVYTEDRNSSSLSTTKPLIKHGINSLCQSKNKTKDVRESQQLQDIESDFLSTDEDSILSFIDSEKDTNKKGEKNLDALCQEIARPTETITSCTLFPDGRAREYEGPSSSHNVKNPLCLDNILVNDNLLSAVPSANKLIQFNGDNDFSFSDDDFSSPERYSVKQTITENFPEGRCLSSISCHRDLQDVDTLENPQDEDWLTTDLNITDIPDVVGRSGCIDSDIFSCDVNLQTSCHSPKTVSGSTTDKLKIHSRSVSPKLLIDSGLLSESTNDQLLPLTNLLQGGKRLGVSGNQPSENKDSNYCTGTQAKNEEDQESRKKNTGFIRETVEYKDKYRIFKPKLHFLRKFEKSCRDTSLHRTRDWVDCSADLLVKSERELTKEWVDCSADLLVKPERELTKEWVDCSADLLVKPERELTKEWVDCSADLLVKPEIERTREWVDCSADLHITPEREWDSAEYGQYFTTNSWGSNNLSVCAKNLSHTQELKNEFDSRRIIEESTDVNNNGYSKEEWKNEDLQGGRADYGCKEENISNILIQKTMKSIMEHPDTTSAGLMEKHDQGVTPESLQSCTIYYWCHACEISLKSEKLAIQHHRKHEDNSQTTVNLNAYLRQVYGCVTKHWRGRTSGEGGILHICGLCDEVVPNMRSFRKHIQTHGERIKCKKCGRTFLTAEELHNHSIESHSKACKKTASKPRKRTGATRRLQRSRELFVCEYCNKSLSTKGSLKIHTRLHTGILPFRCSICSKGYPQNVQLKIHMKSCRKVNAESLEQEK